MSGKTVAVTGGRGRFGAIVVRLLADRGWRVISIDRSASADSTTDWSGFASAPAGSIAQLEVDLNDFEAAKRALRPADAVIHLAAYPRPTAADPEAIFANNVNTTFHILEAAAALQIGKMVLASSESAYGFPWAGRPLDPLYVPVDEEHPLIPEDCYGLSKALNEETGVSFHRRTGMQVVMLRLSTLCDEAEYDFLHQYADDPGGLRRILWSYVDMNDAADACVRAAEADGLGAVALNICADDTCSSRPSESLLAQFFPDVRERRGDVGGFRALYSNRRAKELLGWSPRSEPKRPFRSARDASLA